MPPKEMRTTLGASSGGPAEYDQLLIAKAPEITKLDRQEGYDLSLVEQGNKTPRPPTRNTSQPIPPPAPASGSHSSLEKTAPPLTVSNGYSRGDSKSKSTPFYRTTKGLVIIIVAALVVVGIAVGAAVGVTQSNKNKSQSGETLNLGEENQSPTNPGTNPASNAASNARGSGAPTNAGGTGPSSGGGIATTPVASGATPPGTGNRPIPTP